MYACSAASLASTDVVDTTGAGDAFIASLVYGICHGKPITEMLQLATLVSARKCCHLGARPGLPRWSELPPELL